MKKKRLCLAASGGGHVRQLLDLQSVWETHDYFFVTEPTAMGQSIEAEHRTRFVPHFAWGQAKLGSPVHFLKSGIANIIASWKIVRSERPDVVITTGAGSMFFTLLFGRLRGARVVLIDSFARFTRPSLFARLAGRLAHERISQAPESAEKWKGARLFDPFRQLEGPRPEKEPLLFATVGATLPFPRLVDWVEHAFRDGDLPEKVVLQVGEGGRKPEGMDARETLPFAEVRDLLDKAQIVVCHGGTGSIITALQRGCHVIAIPRTFARGEHYDDHQSEITNAMAERGLIQVAHDEDSFRECLQKTASREPVMATSDPSALRAWLSNWLDR